MSINPRSFGASKSQEKCEKSLDRSPHELSDNNRADRVRILSELLQRNEQTPFLENLVTGDESWLLFKSVKRKKVCFSPGVSPKGIPKHADCKKTMWCVWRDRSAREFNHLPSKGEATLVLLRRNRYCIDKNYAGFLIIWDRMFGTFEAEKEQVVYGTVSPINTFESLNIQFGDTVSLLKRAWSAEGWSNKLFILFKGPNWSPGKPWCGYIEDIPEVQYPVRKYDPHLPLGSIAYVVCHSLLIPLTFLELHKFQHLISPMVFYGVAAYLIFTLACVGCILERRSSVSWMELVRCLLYVAVDHYFFSWPMFSIFSLDHHMIFLNIIRCLFLISGIIWLNNFYNICINYINSKKLD
ncbi:alkylglycerol monooxygenase [Trichonephila clavipes]|nr:alkylglycerol monooxygenase [Trichonephila clavipes]